MYREISEFIELMKHPIRPRGSRRTVIKVEDIVIKINTDMQLVFDLSDNIVCCDEHCNNKVKYFTINENNKIVFYDNDKNEFNFIPKEIGSLDYNLVCNKCKSKYSNALVDAIDKDIEKVEKEKKEKEQEQ